MAIRSMTQHEIWDWYTKSNKIIMSPSGIGYTILAMDPAAFERFIKIDELGWISYHDIIYEYTMSDNCPFIIDDYSMIDDNILLDRIQSRFIKYGAKVYNRSNKLFANIISINRDTKQIKNTVSL